jgi:ferric-dicitrate binding protein FerR (iron transport regulator)
MYYRCFAATLSCLFLSAAFGATPLGSITASGSFDLSGVSVPAVAARSLPVVSGDEVKTADATAILLLEDRSRVTVGKQAQLRIERSGPSIRLLLARGGIRFHTGPSPRLQILATGHLLTPEVQSEGVVTAEGSDKGSASADQGSVQVEDQKTGKKTWLTRRKAIVLTAAGAAAATAVGLAVGTAEPPPQLPPRSPSEP